MLDPISALSTASSAIEIVEFSYRFVCKTSQLYKSVDGVLDENRRAETVTMRLKEMIESLQKSEAMVNLKNQHDKQLRTIYIECLSLAEKLLNRLYQLRVPPAASHRKWKSFRQAFKSICSKSEIDEMAADLTRLREELNTYIIIILKENFDGMIIDNDVRFARFDQNTQKIIKSISDEYAAQSSQIRAEIQDISLRQRIRLEEMRMDFVEKDCEKRRVRIELDLLESLRFPEMDHRYAAIGQAHSQTFEWVFQDPLLYSKPWDNFQEWLQTGSGPYWIQGKAASGKSTLMKFIWDHPSAMKCLKTWAKDCSSLFVGAFFFWNSGSAVQRSFEGLLRTLLYLGLRGKREFISVVFQDEWERKSYLAAHDFSISPENWSLGRLKRALKTLMDQAGPKHRLCFFIDGLDEYDGSPDDIAEYAVELAQSSEYVKFCISSRPWPVFQDIFRDSRGLKLHDLTKNDIQAYVENLLGQSRQMQRLLSMDRVEGASLIQDVVERADGVFLWVVLVIKSLISGLRNGDNVNLLRRRLRAIPEDIENVFNRMLNMVDKEYREESSKIFQIFRASGYSVGTQTLMQALRYDDYTEFMQPHYPNPYKSDFTRSEQSWDTLELDNMGIRINSRTMGLLEVNVADEDLDLFKVYPRTQFSLKRPEESLDEGGLRDQDHTSARLRYSDVKRDGTLRSHSQVDELYQNQNTNNPVLESQKAISESQKAILEYPSHKQILKNKTQLDRKRQSQIRLEQMQRQYQGRYYQKVYPDAGFQEVFGPESSSDFLQEVQEQRFTSAGPHDTGLEPLKENFPIVSYIHQTARRYMEQPAIWQFICSWNKDSSFDPTGSLMMAYYLNARSLENTGMKVLSRIAQLDVQNVRTGTLVLENIDKRLTGEKPERHWSTFISGCDRVEARTSLQCDLLGMSLRTGIFWYADKKLSEIEAPVFTATSGNLPLPFLGTKQHNGLPLIAQVLYFDLWGCEGTAPCPNPSVLERILQRGQDPNELYQGHTIWQHVLHYVHLLTWIEKKSPNFPAWQQVFTMMLTHGADPWACCFESSDDFAKSVALMDYNDIGCKLPIVAKHCTSNVVTNTSLKKTYSNGELFVKNEHEQYHSVNAVVYDAFISRSVAASDQLSNLLQQKQKQTPYGYRRGRKRKFSSSREWRRGPDWIS